MHLTLPDWLDDDLRHLAEQEGRSHHAILLYGQGGIGKRALGSALARSLLCESVDPERRHQGGCGECPACHWFDQGNHPDFRKVVPEAVAAAEGQELSDDPSQADESAGAETSARGKRTPSREIRVDQVRALQSFVSVATHRSRFRTILVYPLETLNDVAANALLKMLEEPPARTVFILVADHLGRIPATIVSRCRKTFIATPPAAVATAWLVEQQVVDAAAMLAMAGGAPLAALAFSRDDDGVVAHGRLLAFLARPDSEAALATAEALGRAPPGPSVRWLQQWLADCIAQRLTGRIRYHPTQSAAIAGLAGGARLSSMMDLGERVNDVRRSVDHPLNPRLLLESLLSAYADAMSVSTQAPFDEHRPTAVR